MASKGLSKKILFYLMILSIIQLSLDHVEANNLSPASHPEMVELVAVFQVKPGLSPSQLTSIDNKIIATKTIDGIIHFSYGSVRRVISSTRNFSHVTHYRFDSQEAAIAYYSDQRFLDAYDAAVPLLDDFMGVLWVARPSNPHPVSLPAGSPVKAQLLKLRRGENKTHCSFNNDTAIIEKIDGKVGELNQRTFGENIGPAELAKGFSIGILGVFPSLNQMDNVEGFFGVGGCVEESLVVDFVTMLVDDHQSAAPPVAEPAGEPAAI